MNCENCGNEHDGSYGSGRFCSSKCSRGFSTKAKRSSINEKVRKTLTKDPHVKICPECKDEFKTKRPEKKFCSRSCGIKYNSRIRWKDEKYRNHMISIAKERHERGDVNFGWQSRKKMNLSYPEKIAKKKLEELRINFVREHKVGKYFIDFALINKKIAIEIDGQQHKKGERRKSDKEKDQFLCKSGWEVIRIKYPDENIRNRIEDIMLEVDW